MGKANDILDGHDAIEFDVEKVEFTYSPGEVKLLQATGSDNTVACAALVNNEFDVVTTPETRHFRLVDEMPESGHWGCLDHNFLTFKIDCTIASARQILRASNMNFNELSLRYLSATPKFYIPLEFHSDVKRKALGDAPEAIEDREQAYNVYVASCKASYRAYLTLNRMMGVRKEQARFLLPLGIYTSFWMSGRLSDWYHFLNLRMDSHTQAETKNIADKIYAIIEKEYPKTTRNWVENAKGPLPSGCIQTP